MMGKESQKSFDNQEDVKEKVIGIIALSFHPNAVSGSHHYTMSTGERDYLESIGWEYEGIAWYGL